MGKTYRKGITKWHKTPKGRKKALINNARNGAVPPDSWDDIPLGRENKIPWNVARKMHDQGRPENEIRETLKTKFNLQAWEINHILEYVLDNQK